MICKRNDMQTLFLPQNICPETPQKNAENLEKFRADNIPISKFRYCTVLLDICTTAKT